ncbi:hypothetical protein [Winogradskyella damuponensis]|uniref:hypothetical protein n=1 Tax=Winogradskyella damuponensis TaxID=943939 RepID=UPI0031DD8731
MSKIDSLIDWMIYVGGNLYVYCTDFTINLANLTGTSYYEVNFFFFCILFPFLLVVLPIMAIVLRFRLQQLSRMYK